VPDWIKACTVDDIDPDDVMPFTHDGLDYALYRSPDDTFHATAGHCTHERELLCDGLVMDGVIECPNGRFDYRTGRALGAPAIVDLVSYPVEVRGDAVFVQI
jgi:3-phenylpropionate/trans-cinnamate dioxygenase ferredoxin subunit